MVVDSDPTTPFGAKRVSQAVPCLFIRVMSANLAEVLLGSSEMVDTDDFLPLWGPLARRETFNTSRISLGERLLWKTRRHRRWMKPYQSFARGTTETAAARTSFF